MHVAFVSMYTTHHEDSWGARRTRRVAELLAGRGHEVTVCCAGWWDGDHDEFEQNDVTYRAVTRDPAPKTFASKLPFVLRRLRPDVIHAATRPASGVTAAKTAARLLRTPVVAEWWPDADGARGAGSRRAARSPDAVVVPSRMVKTWVRETGADADTVRVIPEPIDLDLVRDAPVDERADLVYARDLDEHANVESFLLALAELRDRDWRAAVIGDGPARADVEATARDLRIDDRVEFLGELDAEEGVPVMKGAHVFAQTATWEPFATNLLWGLACGCVGIVEYQADSAAHELVEGCDRGVRVTNPQELAHEIEAVADAERMTEHEAFASYHHREVLERYLSLYRELLDDYGFF